jgi:hypothetical protein
VQQTTAFNALYFTMGDFLVSLCRLRPRPGSAHNQVDVDGTASFFLVKMEDDGSEDVRWNFVLFSEDCVSLTDFLRASFFSPI